jgi:Uma2 family endonuclease
MNPDRPAVSALISPIPHFPSRYWPPPEGGELAFLARNYPDEWSIMVGDLPSGGEPAVTEGRFKPDPLVYKEAVRRTNRSRAPSANIDLDLVMPTLLKEAPAAPSADEPRRKIWTRDECKVLESSGLLDGQRLELIEGDLIDKMGKLRPHVIALHLLKVWLMNVFGPYFIQSEAPIDVASEDNPVNEPEPDLIVLKQEMWKFNSNPQPADLHLIVEVADTTVQFDRRVKAALYARAGIRDYWVLDVRERRLIIHRDPVRGEYTSVIAFGEHESVAPLAAPNSPFPVRDAFRTS